MKSSYRDVEELLVERGVEVDHVTVYRWVQRFTPLLADAARFCRHSPGDRWFVDETYVKGQGRWRYVYRAVDQDGQVIDVLVSAQPGRWGARRFFRRALSTVKVTPSEVVTDAAAAYPGVLDELIPQAWHHVERHTNNPIEADHSQLKHHGRGRQHEPNGPLRSSCHDRTASPVRLCGHCGEIRRIKLRATASASTSASGASTNPSESAPPAPRTPLPSVRGRTTAVAGGSGPDARHRIEPCLRVRGRCRWRTSGRALLRRRGRIAEVTFSEQAIIKPDEVESGELVSAVDFESLETTP